MLLLASNWLVEVQVPACYKEKTLGLCGNYNGDTSDEFADINGTLYTDISKWGATWMTEATSDQCSFENPVDETCNDPAIEEVCGRMKDREIFGACVDYPEVEQLYEDCKFDLCLSGETDEICPVLTAFAQFCFGTMNREGKLPFEFAPEICTWSEKTDCAPECGTDSEFNSCARPCVDTKTCGTLNDQCPPLPSLAQNKIFLY